MVELLLPAGNKKCLRAAVANGADAVYMGLNKFNARDSAGNFKPEELKSIVKYCHERNVKVYITMNVLVKNHEIPEYLKIAAYANHAGADAVIIQDAAFIPLLKKEFPNLSLHLSTQATITNHHAIPKGIDRVVLARELDIKEIESVSKHFETEVFVHGALCVSYSGQCLFSSVAGQRSANRGMCAQACRKKYNTKYLLSTKELCLLNKLPEVIAAGVESLKVEGRMRSPLYVATVARIYRKYLDLIKQNKISKDSDFKIDESDMDDLYVVFNREFTSGLGFEDHIIDAKRPMNRGLYIGQIRDKNLLLKKPLSVGDGVGLWIGDKVVGAVISNLHRNNVSITDANKGDIVTSNDLNAPDKTPVYKTSAKNMKAVLGDEIEIEVNSINYSYQIKNTLSKNAEQKPLLCVYAHSEEHVYEIDKAGADIIYTNDHENYHRIKSNLKNATLYLATPRMLSDKQVKDWEKILTKINPDGVMIADKGLLKFAKKNVHLDYTIPCFNDIDLGAYDALPFLSPELNIDEMQALKGRNFLVFIHGDLILMNLKQKIKAAELVDEEGRHFQVRKTEGLTQIINNSQVGLFNHTKLLYDKGVRYFYIDTNKDPAKFVRIYKKILDGKSFDDKKIRKGYTTGHLFRGCL